MSAAVLDFESVLTGPTAVQRFLSKLPLAGGLNADEVTLLARVFVMRRFAPGEVIVAEGARFGALCLVYRGEVSVEKRDPESAATVLLSRLGVGGLFGEMSWLDEAPASATVRAETDCVVLRLDRARLDAEPGHEADRVRDRLFSHAAQAAIGRLRTLGESFARSRRAWEDEKRRRAELSHFVIVVMLLFGVCNIVQHVITPGLSPMAHMAWSWSLLLVLVGLCAHFARGKRLALFGLTRVGVRRSLAEGAAIGGAVAAAAVAWKWATLPEGEALFSGGSIAGYTPVEKAVFLAAYPLHCFLQELVARGIIQGSLDRLVGDARPYVGTLVTALMFGLAHLYVSASFAFVTFAASLVFGAVYARHRNLAGVTATHLCLGLLSLALGFN
jgi:CRP-like cAMP-binding protein/membrane protease YdiL (CAAX protease family)